MAENKNPAAIVEFENKEQLYAPKSVGAEMVATREAQEVQVAMAAAKRFPRDPVAAYNRVMVDCSRKSLAEKALYEYPRGGNTVTGPSIHLARVLARNWGNLKSGFKVLEETPKTNVVMAYCHDLETNYYEEKVFNVSNLRVTKSNSYTLTDPRDIYENIANQAARRERSCILAVIPTDVVEAAIAQCQLTLEGENGGMPLIDMIRHLVKCYQAEFGVTSEMLEKFIGRKKEAFSRQSVIRLRNIYNSLRDGSSSPEQYFDMSLPAPEAESPADGEKTAKNDERPESVSLDDL